MEEKSESLWEILTGSRTTPRDDFYAKMFMIGLDIRADRVSDEDYEFYVENFGKYIYMERRWIAEDTDRYEEE
jgi:hypothetical protein